MQIGIAHAIARMWVVGVTALCSVPAQADDADAVGNGITHAAAVAIFCSEQTVGEVGAPVPVITTYLREASARFAERFGKPVDQVADYAAATRAVRSDP